ncbi:hypothetical protein C0989_006010 [Termitomyces sp. Mn162]|nr:hypothetical protein C0989_006010 [Termitomyces sp. Mn162]
MEEEATHSNPVGDIFCPLSSVVEASFSFQGGASYETGFCPHGVSYDEFEKATESDLAPMRVHEGTIAFMFETSMMLTITDYAMHRSGKLHEHEPKMWDDLKAQFMEHLDEVKAELAAADLSKPASGTRF